MLQIARAFWKSLAAAMFLLGLFWVPADMQDYDQALGPWRRVWAMVDRETLLWAFAIALFIWLVWTDARPFVRDWLVKRRSPRSDEHTSDGGIKAAIDIGGESADVSRLLVNVKDIGQFNTAFRISGTGHKTITDSAVFFGGEESQAKRTEDDDKTE